MVNRILHDTSPLVAICNEKELENHYLCTRIFRSINAGFVTTLPCLTEAMYLLQRTRGWEGERRLWGLLSAENVKIHDLTENQFYRMGFLMEKYQDTPMDFADASLVVAAEELKINKIFTIDSDFAVYRIREKEPFEIIP